mmetsp:Transcript_45277/g.144271  ORF Transcript_45277/g.144271 Transcript_45277/m.144271 type:complete len:211 (+) Transcript_45277:2522-3154(+)
MLRQAPASPCCRSHGRAPLSRRRYARSRRRPLPAGQPWLNCRNSSRPTPHPAGLRCTWQTSNGALHVSLGRGRWARPSGARGRGRPLPTCVFCRAPPRSARNLGSRPSLQVPSPAFAAPQISSSRGRPGYRRRSKGSPPPPGSTTTRRPSRRGSTSWGRSSSSRIQAWSSPWTGATLPGTRHRHPWRHSSRGSPTPRTSHTQNLPHRAVP